MRRVMWGCFPSPPKEPSPTRTPTRTPRSNWLRTLAAGSAGTTRELFHRREKRETQRRWFGRREGGAPESQRDVVAAPDAVPAPVAPPRSARRRDADWVR